MACADCIMLALWRASRRRSRYDGVMIARVLKWRRWSPATRHLVFGLAVGAAMPICSALIANALDTYLHVKAPSMTFLVGVILAAIWFGRSIGLATALFAFFIYNFYLTEPRNTLGFAGWEDVLTLLVFVSTALLIGGVTGAVHDERERAQKQARIFSGLFGVSRAMAECRNVDEIAALLVSGAREIVAQEAVALRIVAGSAAEIVARSPEGATPSGPVIATATRILETGNTDIANLDGWRLQLVRASGDPIALLAWRPRDRDDHQIAVRLLAELAGNAVARARYQQSQMEMEAVTGAERLRTALMSSISHDFRTPLSTILTSATSMQTYGDQFSPATRADLLTSIQEEAERLNRYIGNILDMTRLDAGVVKLRQEWIDPVELLDNVQERMQRRMGARRMAMEAPAAVPAILVDPLLLEQAIVNAVENCLAYTPATAVVRLGADYTTTAVSIWVEDDGPGVPAADLPFLFDKFHRLGSTQNTQGAGLGLAISKGFIEAMGGEAKASTSSDGGLRVAFTFPLQMTLANA